MEKKTAEASCLGSGEKKLGPTTRKPLADQQVRPVEKEKERRFSLTPLKKKKKVFGSIGTESFHPVGKRRERERKEGNERN